MGSASLFTLILVVGAYGAADLAALQRAFLARVIEQRGCAFNELAHGQLSGKKIADYQAASGFRAPTPDARYVESYNALGIKHSKIERIMIDGVSEPVEKVLGQGYRGQVVLTKSGRVIKHPKSAADSIALEIEAAVAADLARDFEKYGIRVGDIVSMGPNGSFLEKRLIPLEQLAPQVLKAQGGQLTQVQLQELRKLFEGAKRYSKEKGIGLDLKADNLFWDGNHWVLFDTGPRTSYLPHGFTGDVPSFEEYLRVWQLDEPVHGAGY